MSTKVLRDYGLVRNNYQGGWLVAVAVTLLRWLEVSRQRHQLAQLDERALKDMGIDRIEALREAQRPFWDSPLN